MGPRREFRGTYSKARQAPETEEDRRKKIKQRRIVPQFDKLYVKKENLLDSSIDFHKSPEIQKQSSKGQEPNPPRKPLAVNSYLTNSTFGSLGHNSANDTFDNFVKEDKKLPAPCTSLHTSGGAPFSSSNSSFNSTGLLYQSLQSHLESDSHDSTKDTSKFHLKDTKEGSKIHNRPSVIWEDCASDTQNVCTGESNDVKPFEFLQLSKELLSPNQKQSSKDTFIPHSPLVSPQLFSSDSEVKKSSDPHSRKQKPVKSKVQKKRKTLKKSSPFKAPLINDQSHSPINQSRTSPLSSNGIYNIALHPCSPPKNLSEVIKTPCHLDFVKGFFKQRLASSHNLAIEGSQFSDGSQSSGKSSIKSALTSTPADKSRTNSLTSSFEPSISPVSGHIQKSDEGTLNSPPILQRRSKPNSLGSHYKTCVSDICCFNNTDRVSSRLSSSAEVDVKNCSHNLCTKEFDGEPERFYNSSMELRSGPFKGTSIPVFNPSGDSPKELPKGTNFSHSSEGFATKNPKTEKLLDDWSDAGQTTKENLIEPSPILGVCKKPKEQIRPSKASQAISNPPFDELSQNFSSEKLKEINSFLNRPSFTVSLKKRQQNKYRKTKVVPASSVKRLTRHTAIVSKLPKFRGIKDTNESSLMSCKENLNTDQSTATEPSFVLPRRRKPRMTTNKLMLRKVEANYSSDSVHSNDLTSSSYFAKPSPVLPRRASVRLAVKKRKDFRAMAFGNQCVSTRPSRKVHKLSYMQFSISSVKSTNSDIDESKDSVGSRMCRTSENESVISELGENWASDQNKFTNNEISSLSKSSVSSAYSKDCQLLKDNVSKVGDEISVLTKSNFSTKDLQSDKCIVLGNNNDAEILDTSLDSVFDLPFKAPVHVKRGKGWIRSLSIARKSILGLDQIGEVRRQTVHRMSMGARRMTYVQPSFHLEISENESHSTLEDPFSQSILNDPRRHVLTLCSQVEPVSIDECFTESRLSCCRKIGEGVYGEVFMTKPNPTGMEGATVLKIMPIEGDFEVNGEAQKKFHEILSEIIISLELSSLNNRERNNWSENYVHVLNCWCVEGSYHPDMLQLWDLYHEEKESENDRPDIFPDTQLYIVLEFTHGGRDLEGFVFNNAGQALAIFLQIAYSLAVAEQELEFEHRDLHWGNVLVATTKESSIDFKISGGVYSLPTQGVKATVIDFTLSRLNAPHCVMYNNLAEDPSLFTAQGDYQFEIYRQMKKANGNEWQTFTPYTNVLWLHYILDKMIKECYYKNIKTKVHKTNLAELNKLKDTMLESESATGFVLRREHFS